MTTSYIYTPKVSIYVFFYIIHGVSLYRVEQRKRLFFKWLVLGKRGADDVGREPADSSDNAVSVAMAHTFFQKSHIKIN